MNTEPRNLDIAEMRAAIGRGELTAGRIAKSCMEMVEAQNEKLRALISIDWNNIVAQCNEVDTHPRQIRGTLGGIPVAIKDLIDVAGQVTTAGSSFFRDAPQATADAPVVSRLRDAGAIIFGKTNLHEFAWGGTSENPHYGFCRNPWNTGHSSGGSSGGSAVAVAARMAPGTLGTDTLGSIRLPSSYCGIVGLKPTYGLLPTRGIFPLAYTFDHVGPMARTVTDVRILFQAMLDHRAGRHLDQGSAGRGLSGTASKRLAGIRIGRLTKLVPKEICHATTWEKYEKAFALAEDEGATIVNEHIADYDAALTVGNLLAMAQASEVHRERMATHPEKFSDDVRSLLELGYLVTGVDYIRAQRLRAKLVAEGKRLANRVDAWILPTTPQPAPPIGRPIDPTLIYFTLPLNVLGFPSIAMPSGLTPDNLPVSIQVVGGPYRENLLLDIAQILEQRLEFPRTLPVGIAETV